MGWTEGTGGALTCCDGDGRKDKEGREDDGRDPKGVDVPIADR